MPNNRPLFNRFSPLKNFFINYDIRCHSFHSTIKPYYRGGFEMKFSISNTIRTNNFKDAAIQEKIMGLWQQSNAFIAQAKEQGKSSSGVS